MKTSVVQQYGSSSLFTRNREEELYLSQSTKGAESGRLDSPATLEF
jgi:hypothetical protein